MSVHVPTHRTTRWRSPLILSVVVGLCFLLLISAIFTVSFKARQLATNAEQSHQITEVLRLAAAVKSDLGLAGNLQTIADAGVDVASLQDDIRSAAGKNLSTLEDEARKLIGDDNTKLATKQAVNDFLASAARAVEAPGAEQDHPQRYDELVAVLKDRRTDVQDSMRSQNGTMNRVGSTTAYGIAFLLPALALYLFEALRRFRLRADLNERLAIEAADRQQALASETAHASDLVSRSLVELSSTSAEAAASPLVSRASHEVRRLRNSALASGATVATVLRPTPVEGLLQRAISESGVLDVGVQLALTDEAALADEENLRFVLVELLQNAASEGGSAVQVTAYEFDQQVVISVIDNGPGLRPEVERAIFSDDRFLVRRETARGTHGSGLRASRSLLEAMGATFGYERDADTTQFNITLPKAHNSTYQPIPASKN